MPSPFSINIPDIHQGTATLWYNCQVPTSGSRLLIDTNGTPTQGSALSLGSSESAVTIDYTPKINPVEVDQETNAVDHILVSESAMIEVTLSETALSKIQYTDATAQFSSGTDSGLPSGAQNYEEITGGGLVVIPKSCIAVISPRRGYSSPGKFFVFVLYQAVAEAKLALAFSRKKESTYKVTFSGESVTTRTVGDRVFQLYRQT